MLLPYKSALVRLRNAFLTRNRPFLSQEIEEAFMQLFILYEFLAYQLASLPARRVFNIQIKQLTLTSIPRLEDHRRAFELRTRWFSWIRASNFTLDD